MLLANLAGDICQEFIFFVILILILLAIGAGAAAEQADRGKK